MVAKIHSSNSTQLKGPIIKYGISVDGHLYALIASGYQQQKFAQQLIKLKPSGEQCWEIPIPFDYPAELRLDEGGNIFVSERNRILKLSPAGKTIQVIRPPVGPEERITSFLAIPNAFIVVASHKRKAQSTISLTDKNGYEIWKTIVSPGKISYHGIVSIGIATGTKKVTTPSWAPKKWTSYPYHEICLLGNKILATFCDAGHSGISIAYCFELESGKQSWQSPPGPIKSICPTSTTTFIISEHGYGAFQSTEYNTTGAVVNQWPAAGNVLVTDRNARALLENNNLLGSALFKANLREKGVVERNVRIHGHWQSYPVIDDNGNIIFLIDGKLMIINAENEASNLMQHPLGDRTLPAKRILLHQKGEIIYSIGDTLYHHQSNLGRLMKSAWPCLYSNNERNPAML